MADHVLGKLIGDQILAKAIGDWEIAGLEEYQGSKGSQLLGEVILMGACARAIESCEGGYS